MAIRLSIEIGPGKGSLTRMFTRAGAKRLSRLRSIQSWFIIFARSFGTPGSPEHLVLIEGDILKTDLAAFGPAAIAGNLPYYITSPILAQGVRSKCHLWNRAVFLMQAEVAERLTAVPGYS